MALKYYGTLTMIYGHQLTTMKQFGFDGYHNQFRIVCKAKSRAEANRITESLGLGKNVFMPDYTCETGNKEEIEFADKYGTIISINGSSGGKYIDARLLTNHQPIKEETL
jgi:hypothetical protein